ncbi:MAG TPA: DUF177 domain-containing protein [Acidimicrobiales bacterium]|nr:DUF177 domain-containing protein [Acidimicrobiales bacterium]
MAPARITEAERDARAWIIDVAALRRDPGSRRRIELSGRLPNLSVSGSAIDDDATIVVDALLESVSEGILVTATVTARWRGECRRCLEPASEQFQAEARELFTDQESEETYPLTRDQLDLAPFVRDACILELPLAPLCSTECAGLCPECGVNRNLEPCTCVPAGDPRWSALASLKDSAAERAHEKDA